MISTTFLSNPGTLPRRSPPPWPSQRPPAPSPEPSPLRRDEGPTPEAVGIHGIMVKYWISMGYFFEISMVFKWWYQVWMGQRNLINHQAWMVETCWNPNKIMGCLLPINWWFGFRNHPQYHGDIMVYLGWWGKVPPLPQVKQPWASDIDYNQYGASTFDFNVFSIENIDFRALGVIFLYWFVCWVWKASQKSI